MKRFFLLLSGLLFLPGTVQSIQNCPPPTCTIRLCVIAEEDHTWIFRRSYYSHNPDDGSRVAQYQPLPNVYRPIDPTYMMSGYRHNQIMFRGADGSADRLHVVETWGLGDMIRPYGEWEYPYRAGATPYGPWGNPQGPWTLPFDSWVNPYGLGKLPNPPWGPYYPPYDQPQMNYNGNPYPNGTNGGMMPYSGSPQGGYSPQPTGPYGGSMPYPSAPPVPEE